MFALEISGWSILLRTLIVYVVLLAGFRLLGKREIGQMTPFDLILVLLIANAVQNAMVGPDTSVTGGLIAAAGLLTADQILVRFRGRARWLRRAVEGSPVLLVHEGQFIEEHLRQEHVDPDEVLMAMREHGISDLSEVKLAVMETDGAISIVPRDAGAIRTRRHVARGLRKPS